MSEPIRKKPDRIVPGDVVVPDRGRYLGIQCEVTDVGIGKHGFYELRVVPLITPADIWSVDYNQQIPIVREGKP